MIGNAGFVCLVLLYSGLGDGFTIPTGHPSEILYYKPPNAEPPVITTPLHWGIHKTNKPVHKDLHIGMNFNKLQNTNLVVSELCLGTMTFGEQVDEDDVEEIMDLACKTYAINFIDTSELFPTPRSDPKLSGTAEEAVGSWLQKQKRESYVISNRVAGFSEVHTILRGGDIVRASKKQIKQAVEGSLKRLKTDYIDLLYLSWPDRYTPQFVDTVYDPTQIRPTIPISEQVEAMNELIREGKIRHYGLGEETPWGLAQWYFTAKQMGLQPPVAASNIYNLINKNEVETHLLETIHGMNMSFIGISPMAGGLLTGKYVDATKPVNGRLHKYYGYDVQYLRPATEDAVFAHKIAADKRDIPLHVWALNYAVTRPFMTSTCFGVTSKDHVKDAVLSLNVRIPEIPFAEDDIELLYRRFTDTTKGPLVVEPLFYEDLSEKIGREEPWNKFHEFKRKRERLQLKQFLQRYTDDEPDGDWATDANEPADEEEDED